MWTVLALVVLGLLALVLFTPLELIVRLESQRRTRFRVGFRWMFGLLRKDIEPPLGETAEEPVPAAAGKKPRRREARRRVHVIAMLRTKGFVRGAARLARRLAHAVRVRDLFVWLRAGFDDPADTGLLCSWLMPVAGFLDARYPGHMDVAPVFATATFGLALSGRVRMTPAGVLWPLLAFGLSPSTIRGFIALRRGRSR